MFGLTVNTTAIILAAVLAVLGLGYLLIGWLGKRSWRVMLRGLGFVLIPLGLLAMGLMAKVVDGINAVVDWAKATPMSTWIMIGLVVAGLGLLLYLIGSFVPPVTGEEADKRRQAIRDRRLAALQGGRPAPAAPVGARPAPVPEADAPATKPAVPGTDAKPDAPMSADDKEIDEILKRHGV